MTELNRYQPLNPAAVSRTDIGQATAIEQSRAVAEVQAAVLVAQQRPRNKAAAVEEMRDATAQMAVAAKAYFRYRRGSENVTGPSIHLARELARCWGNIDYGVKELRRDDAKGESEMLAHAWDMQTNARASTTFVVPHTRDTKQGTKKLTETRDIYENNANAAARRLREQVLAVLPTWFVEEAKANCDRTLEGGGGKPLAQRIADATRMFDALGVTVAQIEAKLGRTSGDWTGHDVGQLGVIYQSIQRGETSVDNEFEGSTVPGGEVSAEQVLQAGRKHRSTADSGEAPAGAPEDVAPGQETADEPPAEAVTAATLRKLSAALRAAGLTDKASGLAWVVDTIGREVEKTADLTETEADQLIGQLRAPATESGDQ